MNKIKVVGGLIFLLAIVLATLSHSIAKKNRENIIYLERLREQKEFTQEVAKSIFYLSQKRDSSSKELEKTIKRFLNQKDRRLIDCDKSVAKLWNSFYAKVSKFRQQQNITTPYTPIVSKKLVNDIYNLNLELILSFDKLIDKKIKQYHKSIEHYKQIQRVLFIILIVLLLYLFTQVREIILLIQKFSKISKNIIKKSTIKGVKPISIESKKEEINEITQNYNKLVEQIDLSIKNASKSITMTTKSLEEVEQNIENLMELLSVMDSKQSDDIFKREDIVIESLEKIDVLAQRLKQLKIELDELIQ